MERDRPVFDVEAPATARDLAEALRRQRDDISAYMAGLSTEDFLAPQGEAWSPAGHVRHLATSVGAVARGLVVPRWALALRFGIALRRSRSFDDMRGVYLQALADGAQAKGRFASSSDVPDDVAPEAWRRSVMERWEAASRSLDRGLERWSERALDRFRMPHPVLGQLTVREMLYFTLYHNAHHARRVHERSAGPSTG